MKSRDLLSTFSAWPAILAKRQRKQDAVMAKKEERKLGAEILKIGSAKAFGWMHISVSSGSWARFAVLKKAAALQRQQHTPYTPGWRHWLSSQELHRLINKVSAGAYEPHLFLQLTGQGAAAGILPTPAFCPRCVWAVLRTRVHRTLSFSHHKVQILSLVTIYNSWLTPVCGRSQPCKDFKTSITN